MQAAKPTSKPSSLIPYHATSTANFALQPQPGSQTVTHVREHSLENKHSQEEYQVQKTTFLAKKTLTRRMRNAKDYFP
jgi:hypothetical protein